MQEHLRRCYFSELFWESCTPHDHSSAVVQMVREGYTWILTPPVLYLRKPTQVVSPPETESVARSGGITDGWISERVSCLDRQPCCASFEDLFNRVITYPASQFTFCDWFLFEPGSAVLARGEVLIYILASSRNGILTGKVTSKGIAMQPVIPFLSAAA